MGAKNGKMDWMKESVDIELQYSGPDVDDGSMSLEDMIPALQGFSSAYGKIASLTSPEAQHKLRVTGVKKGSFRILLEAWNLATQNASQLEIAANITAVGTAVLGTGYGAIKIVKWIVGVVKATKHTKKRPYTETINADNQSVVITNCDNVTLEVPLEVFRIYKEGIIAQDLNKIAYPLQEGQIKNTTLRATSGGQTLEEGINLEEKKFFDVEEVVITETKEMWLTGVLNSLTKTTNRGSFYLNDGTRVGYRLAVEKPDTLYPFFIHKGPVKVRCKVSLDENLKPAHMDIYEIIKLQTPLFDESVAPEDGKE